MSYNRLVKWSSVEWAAGASGSASAEHAYRVEDLNFDKPLFDVITNNSFVGKAHGGPNRVGGQRGAVNFTSEFRGSTVRDYPAPEMALLRACAFSESATSGANGIYYSYALGDPHFEVSTYPGDLAPINLKCNDGGLERQFSGCVGNVRLNWTAGQMPRLMFEFQGATSGASYEATPPLVETTSGSFPVPCQNYSLTISGASLGSISGETVASLDYDPRNEIDPRADLNGTYGYNTPIITSQNPDITIVIDATNTATVDWEVAYITTQEELLVSLTHHSGGGVNKECAISFDAYLSEFPVLSEVNNKLVYTLKMMPSVDSGAVPLTLAFASGE